MGELNGLKGTSNFYSKPILSKHFMLVGGKLLLMADFMQ
jgi:hypothetical protein